MGIFSSRDGGLKEGDPAPDFELTDQSGNTHRLEDYRGQWVLLYFYPKDDTPGCTKQACGFRDDFAALGQLGLTILGISLDDEKSHGEFARKFNLPFALLSDRGGKVAHRYGSLMSLGILKFAKRHSFIVDPEGRIARINRNVDAEGDSQAVMAAISTLSRTARSAGVS